jgi:hypothetical protein
MRISLVPGQVEGTHAFPEGRVVGGSVRVSSGNLCGGYDKESMTGAGMRALAVSWGNAVRISETKLN